MNCPKCKTPVKSYHKYCPYCGICLIRIDYKNKRWTIKTDVHDWIDGYFIGDGL